uniref:Uncharacterized protein n=1 Tax=Ditylenchus dipsaci TaxID=166011 RepID=A0A915DJZ7_9BILA
MSTAPQAQRSSSPAPSMATNAGEDIRRKKTRMVDEIVAEFENLNIHIGDPHMEEKIPGGTNGERIKVLSNVFGIKMAKIPVFRYDITLSALFSGRREGKKLEFTKRSKEDSVVVDRKNMCRIAFECMVEKFKDVFGEDVFNLDKEDCQNVRELQRFAGIEMLVRKVRDGFELTLGDLSHLNNDTTNQNHSLQQFIELATSQYPLFAPEDHLIIGGGSSFLMCPDKYNFTEEDGPKLSDSKYLAIGAHKSVRFVEGPKEGQQACWSHCRNTPGSATNFPGISSRSPGSPTNSPGSPTYSPAKKTPFHIPGQTLYDKAVAILGPNAFGRGGELNSGSVGRIHSQFKALHVELTYGRGRARDLKIGGVDRTATAANKTIDVNGETVSVEEYYYRKYEIALNYPNAPLATATQKGQTNYFPLELCYVKDNQRANLNQLNQREVANMIRACAVVPSILKNQIERNFGALHLQESPYLQAANMKVMAKPLAADARRLPAPVIKYRNGNVQVEADTGKWKMMDSFLIPMELKRWAIYMIPGGSGEADRRARFTFDNLVSFTKMYTQACRAAGMQVAEPLDSKMIGSTAEEMDRTIAICHSEQCQLVFFVTADAISNLHNVMKSCEQRYGIVTQDLKMNNAFEIVNRGKQETVKNIVCKTNEKLGGLNYSLTVVDPTVRTMISEGTLFIGLGISHPGAMGGYERARNAQPEVPSVIGFAANMKADPFDFVGDFVYDEPRRDEKFSTIYTIVQTCVNRFRVSRGAPPSRLVIYRNGTSEGQFGMSLQYEVPLIHHALKESEASDCKLTLLVSQKAHNIRLFQDPMPLKSEFVLPNGRVKKLNLNIKPGTVIDAQLTHPEHSEFYLNSHLAIQGTARTPRYSVLLDESKFSMDIIEGFTYALSYAHQIINSPTSLPSPAYIALMYAKRGRALFSESTRVGEQLERTEMGAPDFQAASNRLSYATTPLADQRVNA